MAFTDIIVATMLAMVGISYYLGVALATLSPTRRLRSVGTDMLEDSGTTIAILVFIAGIIVAVDFVFQAVYGALGAAAGAEVAYDVVLTWVGNELTLVFAGMLRIEMIPILLESLEASGYSFGVFSILAGFLRRQMAPWSTIFNLYGMSLSLLRAWILFVRYAWLVLLFVGALIYTFPVRIGRTAGGWLMAIAVSFYTLLPLTGVFVDIMTVVVFSDIFQKFQMAAEDVYTYILANQATENIEGFTAYIVSGLTSSIGDFGTIMIIRFILVGLYFAIVTGVMFSFSRVFGAGGRRIRLPGMM